MTNASIDAARLLLFHHPEDRLRATNPDDRSWLDVKPVWASPLARPGRWLALLDGGGSEIALVEDPSQLQKESWDALQRELSRRYLTAYVRRIISARQEYGATYWLVETDRGEREFVTQSLQENALWFSTTHLLLLDVDGNRFEIRDTDALDERSRSLIQTIL
jgi:hypothetical protein